MWSGAMKPFIFASVYPEQMWNRCCQRGSPWVRKTLHLPIIILFYLNSREVKDAFDVGGPSSGA